MEELDNSAYFTQQYITIDFWEWTAFFCLFFLGYLFVARKKLIMEEKQPEYSYFVWGYYAKIFGSIGFVLVYYYYYGGGDTMRYFESGMSMANLFYKNPSAYFEVMISSNTEEARSNFDFFTGMPYIYLYQDTKTYFVIKLISPIIILTGKSYLLTSSIIGFLTYLSSWKLFRLFYKFYPQIKLQLAISTLFLPSVLFWGSGVSKDSFTMAATCLFTFYFYQFFILKSRTISGSIIIVICAYVILAIKPYIFMILFPGILLWGFYNRLKKINNIKISLILFPFVLIFILLFSYLFFQSISGSMDKFSVDNALQTASVTQNDLKQDYYEGKSFNIGSFDGTPASALRLLPMATIAGSIRPFLWEANSPFMLLSALENIILLYLIMWILIKGRVKKTFTIIRNNPIIFFCLIYSFLFSYMLGLTTSNFGALVRFKIPMLPFFCALLFILQYEIRKNKRETRIKNQKIIQN